MGCGDYLRGGLPRAVIFDSKCAGMDGFIIFRASDKFILIDEATFEPLPCFLSINLT